MTKPPALTPAKAATIVWESLLSSLVQTILVLAMGTLAVNIVSDLIHDMLPSTPPVLESSRAPMQQYWHSATSLVRANGFILLFTVLSVLSIVSRLASQARTDRWRRSGRRMRAFGRRLSSQWFGLVVGNAFGALVSALVLVWVQQWSVTQVMLQSIMGWLLPELQELAGSWLGPDAVDAINRWCAWYGGNQFKFAFWVFYIGSVGDDMGLPNFKTLGRKIWRRLRRPKAVEKTAEPVCAEANATSDDNTSEQKGRIEERAQF